MRWVASSAKMRITNLISCPAIPCRLILMFTPLSMSRYFGLLALLFASYGALNLAVADDKQPPSATAPITQGQKIFSCGHSFHVFVPQVLADLAKAVEIKGHEQIGLSRIGGSRVIQHWEVADDKFNSKEALKSGKVDVLTLSPIHLPDEGIENFTRLALEHNPNVRITVQEFWLPFDTYDVTFPKRSPKTVDHNAPTGEQLWKLHEPYFASMDEHVSALNKKFGKQSVYVVPVGQAVIALREKIIAGEAPGLKTQEDLFTDPIGHVKAPIMALNGYCHYAVIYRSTPVGLPVPAVLKTGKFGEDEEKLNALLQELAWDAVTRHPLSGVKGNPKN